MYNILDKCATDYCHVWHYLCSFFLVCKKHCHVVAKTLQEYVFFFLKCCMYCIIMFHLLTHFDCVVF